MYNARCTQVLYTRLQSVDSKGRPHKKKNKQSKNWSATYSMIGTVHRPGRVKIHFLGQIGLKHKT